jgi:hypothetical protein
MVQGVVVCPRRSITINKAQHLVVDTRKGDFISYDTKVKKEGMVLCLRRLLWRPSLK